MTRLGVGMPGASRLGWLLLQDTGRREPWAGRGSRLRGKSAARRPRTRGPILNAGASGPCPVAVRAVKDHCTNAGAGGRGHSPFPVGDTHVHSQLSPSCLGTQAVLASPVASVIPSVS